MKKILVLVGLVGISAWISIVHAKPLKTIALKCQVVDARCDVTTGNHGVKNSACALKCLKSGSVLLLRDSHGNLYIPVNKNFQPIRTALISKAGKMITIKI